MFGRKDSLSNALAIANYKFYWLNLAFCPHNFFSCIFFSQGDASLFGVLYLVLTFYVTVLLPHLVWKHM